MKPVTQPDSTDDRKQEALVPIAIVSLLGDAVDRSAATRTFEGRPVVAATVERIREAAAVASIIVLAWDDQLDDVRAAVGDEVTIRSAGPRRPMPWMDGISAALRWSDGWRGGLLGATEFDRGFDISSVLRSLEEEEANAALLVSPWACFVEPQTIRSIVERLEAEQQQQFSFAAGPVGSVAMLLRRAQLDELVRSHRGPGSLLTYHPDRPAHDPLAKSFAVAVPSRVARTLARVAPDGNRVARRLELTQLSDRSDLESLVVALEADHTLDPLPREVVIDITTRRATKPIWTLHATEAVEPTDLSVDDAKALFQEIASVDPDTRISFSGIGDPLMHPQFLAILSAARSAGIRAIHVETDLLPADPSVLDAIVAAGVDVVSFHLPAAVRDTYQKLMGVDRIGDVIANVQRMLAARSAHVSGVPILVPTFVKCIANYGQMEAWYDQWIRAIGVAVIAPATDLAGRIPKVNYDDLSPPMRRGCRRLSNRITVRSDGSIVPCEEATCGSHAVGRVDAGLSHAWNDGLSMLRSLHAERRWDESELCRSCGMWDRP